MLCSVCGDKTDNVKAKDVVRQKGIGLRLMLRVQGFHWLSNGKDDCCIRMQAKD
jgi:hypothetical protein